MSKFILNLPEPIVIVGLGLSGDSAQQLLLAVGVSPKAIFTFDQKQLADLQAPDQVAKLNPKTLVVSPGVPLSSPWIQNLVKNGCYLTSEIALAASLLDSEIVIGITGSLGKSTTTCLLGEILKSCDPNAFIGGNLGFPLANYARGVISGKPRAKYIALELSSYHLENLGGLRLSQSLITYLSPNHLERYLSLEHYYETKLKIFSMTNNSKIVNSNGGDAESFARKMGWSFISTSHSDSLVTTSIQLQNSKLLGAHNADNIAMAIRAAMELKIDSKHFVAALNFRGLPHRLEYAGELRGIHFVNDSKATALDSVLTAVQSVESKLMTGAKIVLLLGGRDKNLPWENLAFLSKNPKLNLLLFGESKERIAQVFPQASKFGSLGMAIEQAIRIATKGDYVVLSPGGTSMDEFANFEKRGEYFVSKINSMLPSE